MKIDIKLGIANATELLHNIKIEAMPPEILQIEELMKAQKPNAAKLAELLSKNPETLGEFLSLANRVLNKAPDSLILEAHAAINLMGFSEIQTLFLSNYLSKNLPVSDVDKKLLFTQVVPVLPRQSCLIGCKILVAQRRILLAFYKILAPFI
ncbi:HDOD domain-containing protein [Thiomicrorhabdus aquaedulcis]|uniref:HDOD domain-containing protein n=1 Tax=Thiomicrorhabdus aquaedulcis TaxID=2211106 RepID=UPI001562A8FC|nr:HDOD domain-containing protein [Thiomicrorhabdus aquaedulcis]